VPEPRFLLASVVLGTPDPVGLGHFYADLLGWPVDEESPEWVRVRPADGSRPGLSFQLEPHHVRPVWPAGPDDPPMQVHLDLGVDDLATGVRRARSLGAELAAAQPQDDVRVMVDPAGHPFCLFQARPPEEPR
jgi:catechol 2,3-dioxygenase-like lactoylglutathione lyase family enzyme